MTLSRRGFLQGLIACAAAATSMPALERAMATVEPLIARATVAVGTSRYLDMAAMNAMLKEYYSPESIAHLAHDESPLLKMVPA